MDPGWISFLLSGLHLLIHVRLGVLYSGARVAGEAVTKPPCVQEVAANRNSKSHHTDMLLDPWRPSVMMLSANNLVRGFGDRGCACTGTSISKRIVRVQKPDLVVY
ncbi:hypothetical protein HNY73_007345 [Argiope bruennichi]|uniref:Secreted protein n=1 Tax=Argiope bruennichi TaxID=94029 RepID=A0A8T0FE74_ARGBR|nr:hypothetical protein HNY73_007345 [Argiope bruennichi]